MIVLKSIIVQKETKQTWNQKNNLAPEWCINIPVPFSAQLKSKAS